MISVLEKYDDLVTEAPQALALPFDRTQPHRPALRIRLNWTGFQGRKLSVQVSVSTPERIGTDRFVSLVSVSPLLEQTPVQGADPVHALELAVRLCEHVLGVHERCGHALHFEDGTPFLGRLSDGGQSCLPIAAVDGGECEIRTHGCLTTSPVFKTGAFNRSANSP